MSTNQMDAVLIANHPAFHMTWERIQRKMGRVLSAAHDKHTTREQYETAIDAAISDLKDLSELLAQPLPQPRKVRDRSGIEYSVVTPYADGSVLVAIPEEHIVGHVSRRTLLAGYYTIIS